MKNFETKFFKYTQPLALDIMSKKKSKTKKKSLWEGKLTINKKALLPIVFTMPLIGIIIAKNRPGHLVLLLLGISIGFYIHKGME